MRAARRWSLPLLLTDSPGDLDQCRSVFNLDWRRRYRLGVGEETFVLMTIYVVVRAAGHEPPVRHHVMRATLLQARDIEVPRIHEVVNEERFAARFGTPLD